jgi:cytochrome c peroxidase
LLRVDGMRTATLFGLGLAALASLATSCKQEQAPPAPEAAPAPAAAAAPAGLDPAQARAMFQPIGARFDSDANPATPAKIALGRMLYFDTRLSKNHDISCNSCHDLANGGVDGRRFSKGHKGQLGGRNAPTVYNAAGQLAQFWDGRAPDVEAQAKGPVLNPVEMAMPDEGYVLTVLRSIPGYHGAFAAAFPGEPDPITYDNFGRAVGAFERGLVTPSRFDRFLGGDAGALSAAERRGLAVFAATGCTACHNGPLLGGGSYQKLGAARPYQTADLGRYEITKQDADRQMFKVPILRNVAATAPYFHDGSIADLPTAVRTMAEVQLGKTLSDAEVADLVAFLGALTGAAPADYVAEPALPPSGPRTPAADPT